MSEESVTETSPKIRRPRKDQWKAFRELVEQCRPAEGVCPPSIKPAEVRSNHNDGGVIGPSDIIEIEMPGKYCVRVGSGVDAQALRRVLDALERR